MLKLIELQSYQTGCRKWSQWVSVVNYKIFNPDYKHKTLKHVYMWIKYTPKWQQGRYRDDGYTSWLTITLPDTIKITWGHLPVSVVGRKFL